MKWTSWLALIAAMSVIGCSPSMAWTPEAKLLASRDTFNATVDTLATAIEAGQFTDAQAEEILWTARAGQQLLDRIDAAVELNQPTSDLVRQFNLVLRDLVAYRKAAERKAGDTDESD